MSTSWPPVIRPFTLDTELAQDPCTVTVSWGPMKQGDTCQPANLVQWADRSIEADGTFGSGGTITLNGSNRGVNYYGLNDPSLTAISKTQNGVSQILELTVYVQPVLTGGDATTSVYLTMLCRRPQHLLSST